MGEIPVSTSNQAWGLKNVRVEQMEIAHPSPACDRTTLLPESWSGWLNELYLSLQAQSRVITGCVQMYLRANRRSITTLQIEIRTTS